MKPLSLVFFLLISFSALANNKQKITIYTYHLKPPMVTDAINHQGLYYDFTQLLNQRSDQYFFETIFVPRKRIERLLENNLLDGILLGVNPLWFHDKEEKKYFWTNKIFSDRDEVISLQSNAIEYSDQSALEGKVFGGVRGFYYFGINELVNQKKIVRVNTANEVDLFTMLLNRRIDSAVVSRSTYNYLIKKNDWQGKFHLSTIPHDIFDRRILVPKKHQKLYQHLTPLLTNLATDKDWLTLIAQYQ